MKTNKLVVIFAILAILLSGFSSPTPVKADWSKVDQRVLDQVAANGRAEFHVVMAFQADVSGAALLDSKVEKTTYVYELLTRTAAQTQAPLLAMLQAEGSEFESFYIYNMIDVTAGRSTLEWLAARPEVARIISIPDPRTEPVVQQEVFGPAQPLFKEFGPIDPNQSIEWNIQRINADDVWNSGFRGEGMVVGDNDTGVEYTHPALVNKYRGNLGGGNFDHNYNWWDAWGGAPSPTPVDYDGHGTHTMGTMVGDDGGANQVGVAPGAQWIACAGLNLECLEFFLAPWDLNHQNPDPGKAPDAINNSWYDPSGYDYRTIIQNLNAAGIAVIKSAGNNGPGCSTISNPGYVPEIIATAAFDQFDAIAYFSSRGPMSNYGDTILKPEVAAPGVDVRSSYPPNGYTLMDGTSMAAPHSTGLVALIWSAAPCLRGNVPATKQIMMETAEAKIDAQCGPFVDHPNDVWGWGILDAQAAVEAAMAVCGGAGWLDGTVTDAGTGDPLQGVDITAESGSGSIVNLTTDAGGYYTHTLLNGAYTVTASTYGYAAAEIYPVVVITDLVTTQDFSLVALPEYTVSGHVYDAVSGAPLDASVEFTDAPVPPTNTDPSGFYSLTVAEGTWNMLVRSDLHTSQSLMVVVDSDKTVNFLLDPLPCILLVDDDQGSPDVRPAYTSALDDLGVGYNVWDVTTQGDPASADLAGYRHLLWFTGSPWSNTFNDANEAAVGSYLDEGGNFFLSSQDYLWDMDLTPFGQSYLHIASFTNDSTQDIVTGANVFSGLGPYTLSYPFTNYADVVNPDAQALLAFSGNNGNAAISYAGTNFNTVFLGFPFETITGLADRSAVMGTAVDFFGGCEAPLVVSISPLEQTQTGSPGTQVSYVYTVTNQADLDQEVLLSVDSIWPAETPATLGVLAAGASATVPVTVTIPTMPEVIIGEDTFTLTASGVEGGVGVATGTTLANVNPGVSLNAPEGRDGKPLEVVSYEFTLTNTGDYTDTFALAATGVWTATLPGGDSTGPLAAGATITVIVQVQVPPDVVQGEFDTTDLYATSGLDADVTTMADVTTTAVLIYTNLLPIIRR